jgi:hypothetical protein
MRDIALSFVSPICTCSQPISQPSLLGLELLSQYSLRAALPDVSRICRDRYLILASHAFQSFTRRWELDDLAFDLEDSRVFSQYRFFPAKPLVMIRDFIWPRCVLRVFTCSESQKKGRGENSFYASNFPSFITGFPSSIHVGFGMTKS